MHTIRRTTYLAHGTSVSLPFIPSLADLHPEVIEAVEGAPAPVPIKERERRGPRPGRVTHAHLTDKLIRSVLNKPKFRPFASVQDAARYRETVRKIQRGGV